MLFSKGSRSQSDQKGKGEAFGILQAGLKLGLNRKMKVVERWVSSLAWP